MNAFSPIFFGIHPIRFDPSLRVSFAPPKRLCKGCVRKGNMIFVFSLRLHEVRMEGKDV
jgi:hypothetical protein